MSDRVKPSARAGRPRYGFYLSARHIGSRERLFLAVAGALVERGGYVDVLAAGAETTLRGALTVDPRPGLQLVDLAPHGSRLTHKLRLALATRRLVRWIDECAPAVLFGTSVPPNLACVTAARWARHAPRVVLRQSNTLRIDAHARYGALRRRPRDRLVPRLYSQAHAIIAVASEVADNLRALGIDTPIDVIPNAVEIGYAEARAGEKPDHPWLVEPDRPILVQIGRLVAKKDQLTLLDAFARVLRDRPARLLIFGEGPMRGALEARVRELSLGDHVELPGYTPNPFAAVARADLFVLSSISEGMPSVLLEALACGTPVVSTDCPSGPAEILGDGKVGRLVEVGDAGALARAMLATLDAPPQPDALIRRAENFAFDPIVERYVDVLEGAAAVRPSAPSPPCS